MVDGSVTGSTSRSSVMASTIGMRRWWVRRDTAVWPFLWRGALPLLGLLLLAILGFTSFAHQEIEANVLQRIRERLAAQGFDWVGVSVSGQEVRLSGTQPAPGAGAEALAIASKTTCPTWVGERICAVTVSGNFTDTAAPPVATSAPAAKVASCERSLADIVGQEKIQFSTGSAAIKPQSAPVLDALVQAARECPGILQVEGHTDSNGTADANRALSNARAEAVVAALSARGLAADRLRARGFGAERPLADNATAQGRAKNRRIEFHVITTDNH